MPLSPGSMAGGAQGAGARCGASGAGEQAAGLTAEHMHGLL